MPRTRRTSVGGYCYHLISRGNRRERVFHDERDYHRFEGLLALASARIPMRVLAWCLMPNHFHLVLWPLEDGDMSRWMQWLMTCHVKRHHRRHETSGRVWEGRFKAFPIQRDRHLCTVLCYVERNPLRAGLVSRAEDWPWSSLPRWLSEARPKYFVDGPVPRWSDWLRFVNSPQTEEELRALRNSTNRQAPFGDRGWVETTALQLDLRWTQRRPGRPKTR